MQNKVVVSYFNRQQKRLWLIALLLSLAIAAVCWTFAFLLGNFTVRVILFVAAIAATAVLCLCISTVKPRASAWSADDEGVGFYSFGKRRVLIKWEEIKEAGFLKIVNPRTQSAAFYIYWAKENLTSTCRSFLKDGVLEHKTKYLGKSNCSGANIILYALETFRPAEDELLLFSRAHYSRPMKNAKVLNWAIEAADKEYLDEEQSCFGN